ncbi:MAG: MauE/DoxX family redox-associated membrane protein [Streptosporangiales bacterium]
MSKASTTAGRGARARAEQAAASQHEQSPLFGRVAQWVTLLARLGLAGVLGYAGFIKVLDPLTSARAVRAYQLLPESLVTPVGYGLPFLEIVLALLLLLGVATRYAGIVGGLIMVAFIVAIASVWARGISIECGCFGGGGQIAPGQTEYGLDILRDVGLVLVGAWIAVFPPGRFALDRWLIGEPTETVR